MDDIVALCRRRGFIWQSSEIYGGINGFWDYGPLGTELKRNLKNAWWEDHVISPPDGPDGHPLQIVGVDCTIIQNPEVWKASGHVAGFNDPMVEAKDGDRFRADHLHGIYFTKHASSTLKTEETTQHGVSVNHRKEYSLLPNLTIIGTNTEEAIQRLLSDRQYQKSLKIRSIEPADSSDSEPWTYFLDFGKGGIEARIWPVALKHLYEHHSGIPSPYSGKTGMLSEPRQFNLMFGTHTGAVQDESSKTYLRPETAQGIFCNFWNTVDTSRVKVPFGMAQIGKAFRNEVTPRNFTYRSREFEQMEIEFFIHPSEAPEWYKYWRDQRYAWWQSVGLTGANLQLREHEQDELAHYAKEGAGTADIEYRFPFTAPGFGELEGVAHRADYDLKAHAEHVGKGDKMMYRDPVSNERYFPHVIEPSGGADRGVLALLCEAYTPDDSRPSKVFMKFEPRMAPIKAAVFPLVNKDGMPEVAEKLYKDIRRRFVTQFDVKQNIGKRYARMDEAGTPYCFTVDSDTLSDQTVTVRHRDTCEQERINIDQVETFLADRIL